jgi:hypothetical protein
MTATRLKEYAEGHDSLHHGHGMYDVPVSNEATEQEVMELLRNAGEMVHYTSTANDPNIFHTEKAKKSHRRTPAATIPIKRPSHSSEEWLHHHRQSHKEVERRRRETINSCITELGRMLNLNANNKSMILKEAIDFISKTMNGHYILLEQHRRELEERNQRISILENELRLLNKNGKTGGGESSTENKRLRLE